MIFKVLKVIFDFFNWLLSHKIIFSLVLIFLGIITLREGDDESRFAGGFCLLIGAILLIKILF